MRDRLVRLLDEASGLDSLGDDGFYCVADYLLESGVIVPPCNVGQTVYVLTTDSPTGIEETKISQVVVKVKQNCKTKYTILAPCVYDDWGNAKWHFCENNFGKIVFLTREEAEEALAERRGQ